MTMMVTFVRLEVFPLQNRCTECQVTKYT